MIRESANTGTAHRNHHRVVPFSFYGNGTKVTAVHIPIGNSNCTTTTHPESGADLVRTRLCRLNLRDHSIQMCERLLNRQRIHLSSYTLARFQRSFQVVSGNLNRQRIGYRTPGSLLVLHPGRMRQRHPNRPPVYQEFNIDRISMAGCNRHNQRLVNTVHLLFGPAIGGVKILVHSDISNISPREMPSHEARPTLGPHSATPDYVEHFQCFWRPK